MSITEVLKTVRGNEGYYITNTARDLSQSDFKNRILLHTDLLAAPARERANFFSLEITGGASVHVDILRKQVDPFLKLELLREQMPHTMFQTLCRGVNLFGYRPYPQNVIRLTVREFAKYVDVWRVFDFMNHIPNMLAVFEEVQKAGKILEPCICFSTGPEHTDEFYVKKVGEILAVTGAEILLCIKNHGGLGTPKRIGRLVAAIKAKYPEMVIHYHGHNTDGNDVGRITAAVLNGAKIVDAADHAFTGYFGPPPILSVIHGLKDEGFAPVGIDESAIIETSEVLRNEREHYEYFESQFKGFSPTVQIHKLPGGAMGSSFEQAVKGDFLDKMPEILHDELPRVQTELGNYWSVTPGSQILWTTAVNNVLGGERYGSNSTGDLKNLLLGKYGPFPFYQPADWIYEKIFGPDWQKILEEEGGIDEIEDMDIEKERAALAKRLGSEPTEQQLVTYLQHPNDAVEFFKFEEKFGKVYVLPPSIFLRRGGFKLGETLQFKDHNGKEHVIEIGPQQKSEDGEWKVFLNVDHHEREYSFTEVIQGSVAQEAQVGKEEIEELAKVGDIRSPFKANVSEISVEEGQVVKVGERLAIVEAMKMQTPIDCVVDGQVEKVFAEPGQALKVGDKMIKIKVAEG
jgi:pyruvate carboxylase